MSRRNEFTCLIGKPAAVRFDAYTIPVTETGCVIWLGEESHNGYGRFRVGSRRTPAQQPNDSQEDGRHG